MSHASQATPARQSPVVWFLVIAGIAFALRLIHLVQLRHNAPQFLSPQMDALYLERTRAAAGSESESVEYDLAIAAYREAIARAGLRRRSLQPGPGALRQEEPAGGVAAYQAAVRANPKHAGAWHNMGIVYRDIGKPELAVEAIEKAVTLNPVLPK